MSYNRTQRAFTDVETGEIFVLYMHSETHQYKLISDGSGRLAKGTEVNGFYIAAHSGVTVKINGKRQLFIDRGQFYNLKQGEKVTHKKYVGFTKFTKTN